MKSFLIIALLMVLIFNGSIASKANSGAVAARGLFCKLRPPKDSGQIKIITGYSNIKSLQALLDLYKDKPVFIDLWATWCGPCLEEFKYSAALYKYLAENNIEIIYASFDKEADDALWRTKIKENNLSGNHILASKPLRDDITMLIWGGIDAFSIPNYILFDKNKKLLNKHCSNPDTGVKLFKEIEDKLR